MLHSQNALWRRSESPQLSVFRPDVHLQKPQHSNIMNSSICSYCHYNSQLLGERTETCPLAGNICGRHTEHTHTSSEENAVLSTLFYFHLIIISLLIGTSLPPECGLLLKVKGSLTHHHSSCIYSHIWAMKKHSENWEAGWSKKPSLPGCLWWDQQKQPHHSEELPWMFRACPFFPGQVAADCDNDQTVALLCNITNTLLPGDGSIDISQLPGHRNYSGAFMVTSFLNFSTPLIYFFGEAPQTFLNWGRVERSQTFYHRDCKWQQYTSMVDSAKRDQANGLKAGVDP